jgi:hypothetical protein
MAEAVCSWHGGHAFMIHEGDLTEARLGLCPVRPGANGNLILEPCTGLGETHAASQVQLDDQHAVDPS